MKINSPLANFVEVLQQVNQTAVKYGAKLKTNEAATRAALIDPILKALGWDPTAPDMIEFEKVYIDTRVDYALTDPMGKVRAIVEAKPLGGNLTDPKITTKLLSYGFAYGIQEVVLTDGIIWQHFTQSTPGNVTPETIDISKDDLITCAENFIKKLDAGRFWIKGTIPSPTPSPEPVTAPAPLPSAATTPITAPPTGNFTPLGSLKTDLHGEPAPKSLRLPDGTVVPLHYWREILSECVLFVLKNNSSIPIPLADKAGKKIDLLSYAKRDKKVTTLETMYNGRVVYIHLNYDANNCVANALYILGFLPKGKTWQTVAVK